MRGHFPYNEFTMFRCAAGAHLACARGIVPHAPLVNLMGGPNNLLDFAGLWSSRGAVMHEVLVFVRTLRGRLGSV